MPDGHFILSLNITYLDYRRLYLFCCCGHSEFRAAWQIIACITWCLLLSEFAGKVYFNSQS